MRINLYTKTIPKKNMKVLTNYPLFLMQDKLTKSSTDQFLLNNIFWFIPTYFYILKLLPIMYDGGSPSKLVAVVNKG